MDVLWVYRPDKIIWHGLSRARSDSPESIFSSEWHGACPVRFATPSLMLFCQDLAALEEYLCVAIRSVCCIDGLASLAHSSCEDWILLIQWIFACFIPTCLVGTA